MLLSDELKAELPGMGSNPGTPLEATLVHVKFHESSNRWKWYVMEFDGEGTFFGLVVNAVAVVVGRFTEAELENLRFDEEQSADPFVRRDIGFQPMTVGELAEIEPGVRDFLADQIPLTSLQ